MVILHLAHLLYTNFWYFLFKEQDHRQCVKYRVQCLLRYLYSPSATFPLRSNCQFWPILDPWLWESNRLSSNVMEPCVALLSLLCKCQWLAWANICPTDLHSPNQLLSEASFCTVTMQTILSEQRMSHPIQGQIIKEANNI